jgi:hypothetical protein
LSQTLRGFKNNGAPYHVGYRAAMYHIGFIAYHAPKMVHGSPCTLCGTWRRERDLNPRSGFKPDTRLAGEPLRPLGHLSAPIRLYRRLEACAYCKSHFSQAKACDYVCLDCRLLCAYCLLSFSLLYSFNPIHIRSKDFRDDYTSIGLLVIFQDSDQRPSHRKSRPIQRVNELCL